MQAAARPRAAGKIVNTGKTRRWRDGTAKPQRIAVGAFGFFGKLGGDPASGAASAPGGATGSATGGGPGSGLWKSTDGGATFGPWHPSPLPGHAAFVDASHGMAFWDWGVRVTRDGGATWQAIFTGAAWFHTTGITPAISGSASPRG